MNDHLNTMRITLQAKLDEIKRILAEPSYQGNLSMVLEGRLVSAELAAIERQIAREATVREQAMDASVTFAVISDASRGHLENYGAPTK